jgi:hypothetical protein
METLCKQQLSICLVEPFWLAVKQELENKIL